MGFSINGNIMTINNGKYIACVGNTCMKYSVDLKDNGQTFPL